MTIIGSNMVIVCDKVVKHCHFHHHPVITRNICGENLAFPVMGGKNDIVLPTLVNQNIERRVILGNTISLIPGTMSQLVSKTLI